MNLVSTIHWNYFLFIFKEKQKAGDGGTHLYSQHCGGRGRQICTLQARKSYMVRHCLKT